MKQEQLEQIKKIISNVTNGSTFYKEKYKNAGVTAEDIKTAEDFKKLPFTTKEELREAYPLNIQAVPDEQIVRIHS